MEFDMGAEMKWLEIITPEIIFIGGQSDLLLSDGYCVAILLKNSPSRLFFAGFVLTACRRTLASVSSDSSCLRPTRITYVPEAGRAKS